MKGLCVMDSISRSNGGIFEAERRLQQTVTGLKDVEVQVVGLTDSNTEVDLDQWLPLISISCPVTGPQAFGYSPMLVEVLMNAQADLGYFVGLWKYPSLAANRWWKRTNRPYVVAPHGMLDP